VISYRISAALKFRRPLAGVKDQWRRDLVDWHAFEVSKPFLEAPRDGLRRPFFAHLAIGGQDGEAARIAAL
jgi:hypothetical protein